jgi:hypothetical protein
MNFLCSAPPADNAELRRRIYQGAVYRLPATPVSMRLVEDVLSLAHEELGADGPVREAQFRLSDEEFFRRAGRLRSILYTEPRCHEAVRRLLAVYGFDPGRTAFDPIRLRIVTHRGFENPKAAPVYYAHRDTWYANPQAQITWWIPLHDVGEEETFAFYPDYFDRLVSNNSEEFDYDRWMQGGWSLKIGWQDPTAGSTALYPGQVGGVDLSSVRTFAARAGEVILFAGAHFHQTRPNTTGRTRFSLDFRTANLDDHAQGLGAPNVDNRSTGSALRDYVQPAGTSSSWPGQ